MPSSDHEPLLVACLCAGWCTACQAYQAVFAAVARQHSTLRCVWIDIEDHSDALGDAALDIDNFPTLMLQRAGRVLFYGTVLPHEATLMRMLDAARHDALARGEACPPGLANRVAALAGTLPGVS